MKLLSFLFCGLVLIYSLFFVESFAEECKGENCITSTDFKISVGDITPSNKELIKTNTEQTVDNALAVILNKIIVIFWVLAVFIMTIGAWYMIIYHGQDEFLSKWKSIFVSGLIALTVALSAGILVRIFSLLLY